MDQNTKDFLHDLKNGNIAKDIAAGNLTPSEMPEFFWWGLKGLLKPALVAGAIIGAAVWMFGAGVGGNDSPKSDFDPHSLYRNAGDGVYKPYPIKPAIAAKLPAGCKGAVRRSPLWKTRAAAAVLALVMRVSALSLLMYVVFLLVR